METYINTVYFDDLINYVQKLQEEQKEKRTKILNKIKKVKSQT